MSYSSSDGATTSPDQKKPKKHSEAAAHNIEALNWSLSAFQTSFSLIRMEGVIGNRALW